MFFHLIAQTLSRTCGQNSEDILRTHHGIDNFLLIRSEVSIVKEHSVALFNFFRPRKHRIWYVLCRSNEATARLGVDELCSVQDILVDFGTIVEVFHFVLQLGDIAL